MVGGYPVLLYFQTYTVSSHVLLGNFVLCALLCYVVRQRIIAKHINSYYEICAIEQGLERLGDPLHYLNLFQYSSPATLILYIWQFETSTTDMFLTKEFRILSHTEKSYVQNSSTFMFLSCNSMRQ